MNNLTSLVLMLTCATANANSAKTLKDFSKPENQIKIRDAIVASPAMLQSDQIQKLMVSALNSYEDGDDGESAIQGAIQTVLDDYATADDGPAFNDPSRLYVEPNNHAQVAAGDVTDRMTANFDSLFLRLILGKKATGQSFNETQVLVAVTALNDQEYDDDADCNCDQDCEDAVTYLTKLSDYSRYFRNYLSIAVDKDQAEQALVLLPLFTKETITTNETKARETIDQATQLLASQRQKISSASKLIAAHLSKQFAVFLDAAQPELVAGIKNDKVLRKKFGANEYSLLLNAFYISFAAEQLCKYDIPQFFTDSSKLQNLVIKCEELATDFMVNSRARWTNSVPGILASVQSNK